MTVERQTQALLDLVEADRRQKCDAILAEALGRRSTVLRRAHADARALMRAAFQEERLRHDVRVDAARANLQTRRRHAEQQRAAALLAAGSTRLPEELLRRWRTPESRRGWIAAVLGSARSSLPAVDWRVVHAPDWPAAERDAVCAELATAQGARCGCAEDPRVRAGLRIAADGNVVDGTLDGLLADRADIGSRLLDLIETVSEK